MCSLSLIGPAVSEKKVGKLKMGVEYCNNEAMSSFFFDFPSFY